MKLKPNKGVKNFKKRLLKQFDHDLFIINESKKLQDQASISLYDLLCRMQANINCVMAVINPQKQDTGSFPMSIFEGSEI